MIMPHEPNEELLSVNDAFDDADRSEARWQAFEAEHGRKRIFIDFSEPLYQTLEKLGQQQQLSVPLFIERVMKDLVMTFAPSS